MIFVTNMSSGRDAPSSEEKVEGTRGQSTTREAPMGSVKRSGGSTSRRISIGYTLHIEH